MNVEARQWVTNDDSCRGGFILRFRRSMYDGWGELDAGKLSVSSWIENLVHAEWMA